MLDPNKPSKWWIMAVNIWKLCVHCGWRNKYRIDPSSYEHCWTSCWNKAWKKFRLVWDLNPGEQHLATILKCCQPFHFQDLIYLVILLTVHHAILVIPIPISWEFGIGSAANPLLKFFFILITCLLDIVLILYGEILSWSLMGVKGFTAASYETLPSQIFFVNVLHF